MILLMCCWIQFANILLRVFASVFINDRSEVKDYIENYKTLIKEIEDYSKKWKDIPYS